MTYRRQDIFNIKVDCRAISWCLNGEEVVCPVKSRRGGELLKALIESGEQDFSLIRSGKHYYLFAHKQSIQITEFSYTALEKVNQLVKEYSNVSQYSSSQTSGSIIIRDSKTTSNRSGSESNSISHSSQLFVESCEEDFSYISQLYQSILSNHTTRRGNHDEQRESSAFLSKLCEGISSEEEAIQRLADLDNFLREKERRGREDVNQGFRALRGESATNPIIGFNQVIVGIRTQNEAIVVRGDTRQQLFIRRIEQLYQEFKEHYRRVKEL
jgi:hypothetical protein